MRVESWSFLTNHARVLLRIADDPGARLRDIAAALGITERRAHSIVTDLAAAGYVVKQKDGRRNRYQVQAHLPLPGPVGREPAIGDVLAVLMGEGTRQQLTRTPEDPRPGSVPHPGRDDAELALADQRAYTSYAKTEQRKSFQDIDVSFSNTPHPDPPDQNPGQQPPGR